MLAAAVLDRSHAFLHGGILYADVEHAGKSLLRLLRRAVDQVVVALVRHRDEAAFDKTHVYAASGVGGFALSDCARIMIEAISAHAATPTSLHLVRLVLFGQPAYDTFVTVAREILGHGQDAA